MLFQRSSPHGALYVPAAAAAPTWTKKVAPAIASLAYGSGTATFSSQAINNASSSDVIVVCVGAQASVGNTVTGITIGGDAMTQGIKTTGTGFVSGIYYITGHTYTTPDIVVSNADTFNFVGITAGILTGVNATPGTGQKTEFGFLADPQVTAAITVPSSGFGIVTLVSNIDVASGSVTFNTGTKDYVTNSGGGAFTIASGYISTSGSQTPSISGGFDFAGTCVCALPWGP